MKSLGLKTLLKTSVKTLENGRNFDLETLFEKPTQMGYI